MKEKLRQLHEKMQNKINELKTLTAKPDYSAADDEAAQALETEIAGIKSDIELEQNRESRAVTVLGYDSYLNEAGHTVPVEVKTNEAGQSKSGLPAQREGQEAGAQAKATPAIARVARLKHFKTAEDALGFGMWFLGAVCGQEKGKKYCRENGIEIKSGHTEGINSDGGATVPTQFSNTIIDLREEYGIFRSLVTVEPMGSDNMIVPRAVSGLTAFPVGESQSGTRSKTAWDNVELTARKWMVLVKYSTELSEDSIISWADRMASEIAMAFAQAEDEAGFIGDGTSAYHKIKGIIPTLIALSGTPGHVAGLVELSGNAWGEITLADFSKMKGRVPAHIRKRNNVKWFCSGTFHAEVMEKLALAAGGNTAAQIVNGSEQLTFMGHPVVLTETMLHYEENSTVPVLLGDLNATAALGDRRGIALSLSEHSDFANDNIEIKGTERFDINVFNPGNADATQANRKAGGVVGGILAAG